MTDDGVDAPVGSVRCTCGATVPVAATDVGQEQVCPKCKASFKVVWAIDPKTKEKVLTRLAAKGGAIRIPAGSSLERGTPLPQPRRSTARRSPSARAFLWMISMRTLPRCGRFRDWLRWS